MWQNLHRRGQPCIKTTNLMPGPSTLPNKAFKKISIAHPELTLEIFGNGPDEDKLKLLASKLGILDKVSFMGVHKDAVLQVADSSCYVMSSFFEGMPNALMEAMAIGLPCVSTDCPNGPSELISNGENGLLVSVGNRQKIDRKIRPCLLFRIIVNVFPVILIPLRLL